MIKAVFLQQSESDWQEIGTLMVENGSSPKVTGNLEWVDYSLELASSRLGRNITWAEDAEQWVYALCEAYQGTEIQIIVEAFNDLEVLAAQQAMQTEVERPKIKDKKIRNKPEGGKVLRAFVAYPIQSFVIFFLGCILFQVVATGILYQDSGSNHSDLLLASKSYDVYDYISIAVMIIAGLFGASRQFRKTKTLYSLPVSLGALAITFALIIGVLDNVVNKPVAKEIVAFAFEKRIKENMNKAHQSAITSFNIPEMGYPYAVDLKPAYDKLNPNPEYLVFGITSTNYEKLLTRKLPYQDNTIVFVQEGGKKIVYLREMPLNCKVIVGTSDNGDPLTIQTKTIANKDCPK